MLHPTARIDLGYMSEKLRLAMDCAYWVCNRCKCRNEELVQSNAHGAFTYIVVAYVELHGVLEVTNDHRLTDRLLAGSLDDLKEWADRISSGSYIERPIV